MDLLEELVAEREIRQLIGLYPQLADDADGERYADLFTEDGVIETGGEPVRGRAAIREWLLSSAGGKPMRHIMVNPYIVIEGEAQASGSMDMALLRKEDDGWRVWSTVRYADTFAKTDEGWKFSRRVLKFNR